MWPVTVPTPCWVALPGKVQLKENSAAHTLSSAGHAKLEANQTTEEQKA